MESIHRFFQGRAIRDVRQMIFNKSNQIKTKQIVSDILSNVHTGSYLVNHVKLETGRLDILLILSEKDALKFYE